MDSLRWKEMGRAMELMLNPRLQVRHILIPADYEEDMGAVAPPRKSFFCEYTLCCLCVLLKNW